MSAKTKASKKSKKHPSEPVPPIVLEPEPPQGPQTKAEVIDWCFYELLDSIISETIPYDPEKDDDLDSILSKVDTLNSEILEFIASRESVKILRETRYQKQPKVEELELDTTSTRFGYDHSYDELTDRVTEDKQSKIIALPPKPEKQPSIGSQNSTMKLVEDGQIVRVFFKSGSVYEGRLRERMMEGYGTYIWADGTVYIGEFRDGYPTGVGEMILPTLDNYKGEFFHGLFHGEGFLNIKASPVFYNGGWQYGRKHGTGWLMYEPNNWYSGGWADDQRNGDGVRYYKTTARYKGGFRDGLRHDFGLMIWETNDYYKGGWREGVMDGFGEYVWEAHFNKTLTFPVRNSYVGEWANGKREGQGCMYFGTDCGTNYVGEWFRDFKHGDGALIGGNGLALKGAPLFNEDKPQSGPAGEPIEMPVFSIAEEVNVDYFIDRVLARTIGLEETETVRKVIEFERLCLKNTIIEFLPKLTEIYQKYATITTQKELAFEPIMIRLFLWMFYFDINVGQMDLSLAECDSILFENPLCGLSSLHDPFEKIYFWQFIMALIGLALHSDSFEQHADFSVHEGACSIMLKAFFNQKVFDEHELGPNSVLLRFIDLVPLVAVYDFYKSLGEPLTARTFFKATCSKISPPICEEESVVVRNETRVYHGINATPLADSVYYFETKDTKVSSDSTRLTDFRILGARKMMKVICTVCPMVRVGGVISNMEYPMVFLEFYEILLRCVFLLIEKRMKIEKRELVREMEAKRLAEAEEEAAAALAARGSISSRSKSLKSFRSRTQSLTKPRTSTGGKKRRSSANIP